MTITLSLNAQEEAKLIAQARAKGVSPDAVVLAAVARILSEAPDVAEGKEPTRSVRGILAKYGPAPSAEAIDRNRAAMFVNFAATERR